MRTLLFLDYWSLDEPLTQATVLPTLDLVLQQGMADRVVLVTVERSRTVTRSVPLNEGVTHVPLHAHGLWPRSLSRAADLLRMVPRVAAEVRRADAGFLMARGVVAGGFAHHVHRRTGVPYAVDYFEPHADYMVDVGEWRRDGVLDRGLKYLIGAQLRTARHCITVTNNYRDRLVATGADADRLSVAPCPVDQPRFQFDATARNRVRAQYGWGEAVIGVYAGKFGGLYHRKQAYRAFSEAGRVIGERYRQIILTPAPREEVLQGLLAAGLSEERIHVTYAQHAEVPGYLSAADLAFAPYRGTPSSACISPMKIGEYWANGLPVLLTRGVGDDSDVIAREPFGGALFDPMGNDLQDGLRQVVEIIAQPDQRSRTAELAGRYHSMEATRSAYARALATWI